MKIFKTTFLLYVCIYTTIFDHEPGFLGNLQFKIYYYIVYINVAYDIHILDFSFASFADEK